MASVFDVAKYVLEHTGQITTMKLQKLVYYCQAWSLAWDGKPLFPEEFRAWANGPVCKELYERHRGQFVVGRSLLADIPDYNFDKDEIKALLKEEDLLSEFYEDWRNSDGKLCDSLQYPMEDTIDIIVENFEKNLKEKQRNYR